MSANGNTLVVGAPGEDGSVNGFPFLNDAPDSGAAFVFLRTGSLIVAWNLQRYLKAGGSRPDDRFGYSIGLSGDGNTLACGAPLEDGVSTGIGGSGIGASDSGAVYVFVRSGTTWSREAYVKASNTQTEDWFGLSVALSADGNVLVVGAPQEDSSAVGLNGNQASAAALNSGAVYVFLRGGTTWMQHAYVKASNTGPGDLFGATGGVSADGNTLAVAAPMEDSNATGINGNQADNSAPNSGAVYVFVP